MSKASFTVERGAAGSRIAGIVALIAIAFLCTAPWWAESGWMREFNEMACYLIFAMMWNLLAGYGGMVSIGQQAYLGLGGYVLVALGNFAGFNPFSGGRCRCRAARGGGLSISRIAFRCRAPFRHGTWVIAGLRLTVATISAVGGGSAPADRAARHRQVHARIDHLLDVPRFRRRRWRWCDWSCSRARLALLHRDARWRRIAGFNVGAAHWVYVVAAFVGGLRARSIFSATCAYLRTPRSR